MVFAHPSVSYLPITLQVSRLFQSLFQFALLLFIQFCELFYLDLVRHGSRINTDRFPKRVQRRKLLGGSAACSPFGNFLDFNSLKSWVSESFRKDIGTISPWKVLFLVKHIISFFKNLTDFGGNLCGSKPACICLIVVFQCHFTLFCIDLHSLASVHLFPFTNCGSLEIKFCLLDDYSAQRLRLQYRSTVLSKTLNITPMITP